MYILLCNNAIYVKKNPDNHETMFLLYIIKAVFLVDKNVHYMNGPPQLIQWPSSQFTNHAYFI